MSIQDAIEGIIRQKDAGIVSGEQAMLKVLEELQRDTLAHIARASTEWQAWYLPKYRSAIEDAIKRWEKRAHTELASQEGSMWDRGADLIRRPILDAGITVSLPYVSSHLLDQLQDFGKLKLSQVGSDAMYKIQSELTLGMTGAKTPQEVVAAIGRNLAEPSIFGSIRNRALAITKHEMGKTFSKAGQENLTVANKTLEGKLKKQWKHVGHPKVPRESHLEANGQVVGADDPYQIGDTEMMYPRDENAPLDETMNCGCDSLPFMDGWN